MGKIIAIINQKGGVGKTTTAVNLSAALGMKGKKVLLADLDPQGNATSGVGINKRDVKVSSYHVLMEEAQAADAILASPFQNLWLLPSNIDLAGAEIELVEKENRSTVCGRRCCASGTSTITFSSIARPPWGSSP